jgi:hypothetical protein
MTYHCLHSGARVFTQPPPTKESEVFENIFEYIDRIFGMIRPRKLLFMAIGARFSSLVYLELLRLPCQGRKCRPPLLLVETPSSLKHRMSIHG